MFLLQLNIYYIDVRVSSTSFLSQLLARKQISILTMPLNCIKLNPDKDITNTATQQAKILKGTQRNTALLIDSLH